MTKNTKFKDIGLLGVPVILLILLGFLLQARKPIGPAQLIVEKVSLAPISVARAVDEIHTPMGQVLVPGTTLVLPKAFAIFQGIDHKATVVINYRGNKPSWWGQDEVQNSGTKGFLTSTASTLAWEINNSLFYQAKGKMCFYMAPDRSAGIFVRGHPRYDATLDRYVAMFYLPTSQVPSRDGKIKLEVLLWPNQVSPAAKVSIWLNKKDKGRHVIKSPPKSARP